MINSKRLNVNPEDEVKKETWFSKFRYKVWNWWYFMVLRTWPLDVIMDLKYDIENGIRNLIRWAPTIWKDRDWEGSYILAILIKKIEFQRRTIVNNKMVHSDELKIMNDDMTRCLDLLRKVNDEWTNYEEPFIDQHEKKWGKRDFDFIPIENEDSFEVEMKYIKELTEDEKEQERNEYYEGMNKVQQQRKSDLAEAMQIIASHVDEWWD